MKPAFWTALFVWVALSGYAQAPCSLDPSFDLDGKLVSDGGRMGEHIIVQDDGKILIACNPMSSGSVYIKRFNDDGSVDGSYGNGGSCTITVAEVTTQVRDMKLHDGNLYICGTTTTNIGGTNTYPYVAAISDSGALMSGFGTNGIKKFQQSPDLYTVSAIELDANGKIYICGLEWLDNLYVLRMNSNGSLDYGFDSDGIAYINTNNNDHWFEVNDIAIDQGGKVLVAGKKYRANNGSSIPAFWNVLVARFLSNGSLDNGFASNGIGLYNSVSGNFDEAKRIHALPGGSYIVCGNTYDGVDYDYNTLKLDNAGSPDLNFGNAGWVVHDLWHNQEMEYSLNSRIMPDGRILLTGNQGSGDTVYFCLLMLQSNGSRDQNFALDGLFTHIFNQNNNSSSSGAALAPNNKIVLGGYTRTCVNGTCGPLSMALARYTYTPSVGIGAAAPASQLQIAPNPAQSAGQIALGGIAWDEIQSITLHDLSGRQYPLTHEAGRVELPSLAPAVYFVRVTGQEGTWVGKLMVE